MSAMNLRSPWRGPLVVPTGSASQAIRQAAAFMYSGIAAAEIVVQAPTPHRVYNMQSDPSGARQLQVNLSGAVELQSDTPGATQLF